MPGWRVGFMVGNPVLVSALARFKSYFDYGTFTPIQVASILALEGPQDCVARNLRELPPPPRRSRRRPQQAPAGPSPCPRPPCSSGRKSPKPTSNLGSLEFSKLLLTEAKVAVSPGIGFGDYGDGHVRFSPHRKRRAHPPSPPRHQANVCQSTDRRGEDPCISVGVRSASSADTATQSASASKRSLHALEASNFFLADVQTGLGPFLAAYLAGAGWNPARVGFALTLGGLVTVLVQTPAGAIVDRVRSRRLILILGVAVLAAGAILLSLTAAPASVYSAQVMIGGAGPFLAPTLAAITMGLVGRLHFDHQFGRNQSFNSAGNVACALAIAAVSHIFGNRAIFITAAALTVPTVISILCISGKEINYEQARGGLAETNPDRKSQQPESIVKVLSGDRALLVFLACAFLFHFANAAMLPQLGEMLAKGHRDTAAPFMSACIIVTQVVIALTAVTVGKLAHNYGRKPWLLLGFGVLPIRALLYTLTQNPDALIAIQILDGIANSIFGVVSILVVADRTRGSGRFNLVQGALATAVGIGAALSTTFGGKLIQSYSYRVSFLALGGIALFAFCLLWIGVPETLEKQST